MKVATVCVVVLNGISELLHALAQTALVLLQEGTVLWDGQQTSANRYCVALVLPKHQADAIRQGPLSSVDA